MSNLFVSIALLVSGTANLLLSIALVRLMRRNRRLYEELGQERDREGVA